ncbi:MAG: FoF1 ATP synthase subunit gamma [Candidatus Binatus sp.]|uniref:F0F1 ATP synthase subunit gamma n=1 Tax=Candidatus Binatus sp. TaxID=2811406 RepID=UPI003BAE2613
MAQERETATRITSLNELREIVAAIRAMAASQMQQALRSLEAIRDYSQQIREALSEAATLLPPDVAIEVTERPNKSGLVIFCAEHGLCGGFNEHLLREAERARSASVGRLALIVVGTRGAQIFRERGLSPDLILPMATHCTGVTGAARRVAAELYRMFSEGHIAGVEVVYAQHAGAQLPSVERHRILPLEVPVVQKSSTQLPPIINLRPQRLFDDIVDEYFFATLENAAMQSFFSENSTRFRTMEAAHQNIRNKSSELTKLMQRLRQDSVTTEILDLISGSEALASS